jgi:signal peptidase I
MRKMFRVLFWVALMLGALIGLLRLVAIRWWRVPSDDPYLTASISPTLHPGDLILMWRLTKPGYADLVMCPEPKRPDRIVIGRIIGEAKDQIEVHGATVTLNNKRMGTESDCSGGNFKEHAPDTGIEVEQGCSIEDLAGHTSMRGEIPPTSNAPAEVTTTVPPDTVWLASDNRLFPYDSRDFGPVERSSCTEKIFFRLVGAGGFFETKSRNQYIR